jgi:hypothetical protein
MTIAGLENKDILQINATIIAGALIFLTFLSVSTASEAENRVAGIIVGSGTVLIFSTSSNTSDFKKKTQRDQDYACRIYIIKSP